MHCDLSWAQGTWKSSGQAVSDSTAPWMGMLHLTLAAVLWLSFAPLKSFLLSETLVSVLVQSVQLPALCGLTYL